MGKVTSMKQIFQYVLGTYSIHMQIMDRSLNFLCEFLANLEIEDFVPLKYEYE